MAAIHYAPDLRRAVAFVSKRKYAPQAHTDQVLAATWPKDVLDRVAMRFSNLGNFREVLLPWGHASSSNLVANSPSLSAGTSLRIAAP